MLKKALIGVGVLVLVAAIGVFFWARSILTQDTVRTALAAQVSKAIGQPVTIASIGANVYPRVVVNLGGVEIGSPATITVRTLQVGTDFGALLSRQIAHATLRLDGARIELPLPPLGSTTAPASDSEPGRPPVEIVSIDEIVLRDVEIVSGKRTLRGDVEAVPQGNGMTLRRVSLKAEDTTIDITGQITDLAGPSGELTLKADTLNFDRLMAFISDFSGSAGIGGSAEAPPKPTGETGAASAMNLTVGLDANHAALGTLILERLSGRAHITAQGMTVDPIAFGLFGGKYDGTLVLTLGDTPGFRLKAAISDIDVAAAMAFAGSPGTMTGRLSGRIDLAGRGTESAAVIKTTRGTVRVDVRDGRVKNLGLVRAVVMATSMRSDARPDMAGGSSEPFSRLGATLAIANGLATTNDLSFESKDLSLGAAGSLALNGSAVDVKGKVQLSEALSQQAGRDLVRYTQEHGRVTLPATITGPADNLKARIDVGSVAERAIRNRANEEAQKALKKGLGGLFR